MAKSKGSSPEPASQRSPKDKQRKLLHLKHKLDKIETEIFSLWSFGGILCMSESVLGLRAFGHLRKVI